MRAAGLDFESRALAARSVAEPSISAPDQVLLRVRQVGVCGTDRELAAFRFGCPPPGESFLTLGHEALAEVAEVGRGVRRLRRGDWVVPFVRRPCRPPCPSCARGRRDLCVSGGYTERGIFGAHGYFSEFAVDSESDLVRTPAALADCAVLTEPLSVAEKAIETALRLHEPGPRTALVLGAGPIGMLAALVLRLRGLETAVHSLEPENHPRAKLLARAGVRWLASLSGVRADIVIEATGSAEAAFAGLRALGPLGVCGILSAPNAAGEVPFIDLLRHNQAVFGSVNASPQAFARAVEDLERLDRAVLSAMLHRVRFEDFRETISGPPAQAVKVVHEL
jgi:threonine dehydrogenase-like Zn-dependent dehydrogenase